MNTISMKVNLPTSSNIMNSANAGTGKRTLIIEDVDDSDMPDNSGDDERVDWGGVPRGSCISSDDFFFGCLGQRR